MTSDIRPEDPDTSIYVGIGVRTISWMVDIAVISGILIIYTFIFERLNLASSPLLHLAYISIFLYDPLMIGFCGATIGHRVMRIHVVNSKDEISRISLLNSFIRSVFKYPFGWLSIVTIMYSHNCQAVHDEIADSVVIYRKAKTKSK